MKRNKIGRTILMSAAAFTAIGGFLFDWNKTHLFNPRWTPHAKFHDAMTIMQAALLGTGGFYLLQQKKYNDQKQLLWGAVLPGFFWTAMASSFAFPGAKGLEAEFPDKIKRVGGVPLNEGFASAFMLSTLAFGYMLARKNK
ncbi:MAG: hypothetical protein COW65_18455 [Cytophagales bacterium CG18_big_fil_WC_8_21_14_2_50_42_9]|nr:MAG: hypothetical protein COW65_18455 [Cytophagales bacterium CG18_big_fil_WC_8_21_14_2_50_42_9]